MKIFETKFQAEKYDSICGIGSLAPPFALRIIPLSALVSLNNNATSVLHCGGLPSIHYFPKHSSSFSSKSIGMSTWTIYLVRWHMKCGMQVWRKAIQHNFESLSSNCELKKYLLRGLLKTRDDARDALAHGAADCSSTSTYCGVSHHSLAIASYIRAHY